MLKITPRFFALPLIALVVIASLPNPAPADCATGKGSEAVAVSSGEACAASPQRIVEVPASVVVR